MSSCEFEHRGRKRKRSEPVTSDDIEMAGKEVTSLRLSVPVVATPDVVLRRIVRIALPHSL